MLAYLKGQYSVKERLKKRGVGSSKVVYESGVKPFDGLLRGMDTETAFASFELQKNGLTIRLNINQRLSCIGVESDEITAIKLMGFPVEVRQGLFAKRKIIYNGKLDIILPDETIKFTVRELEFKDIVKFFSTDELSEKFHLFYN